MRRKRLFQVMQVKQVMQNLMQSIFQKKITGKIKEATERLHSADKMAAEADQLDAEAVGILVLEHLPESEDQTNEASSDTVVRQKTSDKTDVMVENVRILFRWEKKPVEAEKILNVLSLAVKTGNLNNTVLDGLVNAIPEEVSEATICHKDVSNIVAESESASSCEPAESENVRFRRHMKNALKKLVYSALSKSEGRELPWGTLSGIRPTKIPLKLINEGKSDDEIRHFMRDTYLASRPKIEEALTIAHTEEKILRQIHRRDGYSLYINIPFCPSTCLYCSFTSYPIASYQDLMPGYIDALKREIDYVREDFQERQHRILDTIYIGGGTPTSLPPELLDELFAYIEEKLDLTHLREWTVEAGRPDSITAEKLDAIRRHKVTRISINPQTMNDRTLKLIGRHHTAQQIREAYALAREKGFDDINMDLIIGLPGETPEDVKYTLSEVAKMSPENLTVHSLALKRTARLNLQWESYENYVMESSDALMKMARKSAEEMGLHPYYLYRQKNIAGNQENVGYALPGHEGIYNVAIMEEQQDIVALGCAADCKRVWPDGHTTRCENVKNVHEYLARVDEMIERKKKLFE